MKYRHMWLLIASIILAIGLIIVLASCDVKSVPKDSTSTSTTDDDIIIPGNSTRPNETTTSTDSTTATESVSTSTTVELPVEAPVTEEELLNRLESLRSEVMAEIQTMAGQVLSGSTSLQELSTKYDAFVSRVNEELADLRLSDTGYSQLFSQKFQEFTTELQNLNQNYIIIMNKLTSLDERVEALENKTPTGSDNSNEWIGINGYLVYGSNYTLLRQTMIKTITVNFYSKTTVVVGDQEINICIKSVQYNVPYYFDTLYIGDLVITPTLESANDFSYSATGYYKTTEDGKLYLETSTGIVAVDYSTLAAATYEKVRADFEDSYCYISDVSKITIVQ